MFLWAATFTCCLHHVRPQKRHQPHFNVSIEIYGSKFWNGEIAGLDPDVLSRAFAGLVVEQEQGAFVLGLAGAGGMTTSLGFKSSGEEVTSFTVSRPVDDVRLYKALLLLLQHEGVVVYAPGSPPVIGAAASEKHLPEGLKSSLGGAVIVETGNALRSALFGC